MYSKLPIYTREKNQMTYLWCFYSYLIQIQRLKFICNLNTFEMSRIFTESKHTKNKKQLKRTLFRHNISKIISISYVPFLNLVNYVKNVIICLKRVKKHMNYILQGFFGKPFFFFCDFLASRFLCNIVFS